MSKAAMDRDDGAHVDHASILTTWLRLSRETTCCASPSSRVSSCRKRKSRASRRSSPRFSPTPISLQQADTSDVPPTSHPLAIEPVWREDTPVPSLDRNVVLQQAPEAARDAGLFKVPKVL